MVGCLGLIECFARLKLVVCRLVASSTLSVTGLIESGADMAGALAGGADDTPVCANNAEEVANTTIKDVVTAFIGGFSWR